MYPYSNPSRRSRRGAPGAAPAADRTLVKAACTAGVELRLSTSFESALFDDRGGIAGARLRDLTGGSYLASSDLLIGADGRLSRVAEAVNSPVTAETPTESATVYGYFDGIPNNGYRWMFSPNLQTGLIPTNDGTHCAFASCRRGAFGSIFGRDPLEGLITSIGVTAPVVADHMRRAGPTERLRRFGGARDARAHTFLELSAKIGGLHWSFDDLKAYHGDLNRHLKLETAELAERRHPRLKDQPDQMSRSVEVAAG